MAKKSKIPALAPDVKAWRDTIKPLKRLGISLFDQQLWCWGYDIRQAGNLLLRFGFDQYRQDKSCGGSAYTLRLEGGVILRLWGGNLVYRVDELGAVHLKRYEFEPRLLPPDFILSYAPPETSGFPETPTECLVTAQLAAPCMRWIAGYERWVIESAGVEHRKQAVQAWKQNAVFLIDVEQIAPLWDESAAALERYRERVTELASES